MHFLKPTESCVKVKLNKKKQFIYCTSAKATNADKL